MKYFIALASTKNYIMAAEQCNVSQPALSMAIRRLEEELDILLIDRKSNPITLTEKGDIIVLQAIKVLEELALMERIASDLHDDKLNGRIFLSVIPTLAPYIVPLFLQKFSESNPNIELIIEEETTKSILQRLKSTEIDAALLVTPLEEKLIVTYPLFYEEFFVFTQNKLNKSFILTEDIDFQHLWLLEEGHCMRQQMLRICELRKLEHSNIKYNAGSIESLLNITERSGGMTIIPELATWNLSPSRKEKVIPFYEPTPVREVSLIHHKHTTKFPLINAIMKSVLDVIPAYMKVKEVSQKIDIVRIE